MSDIVVTIPRERWPAFIAEPCGSNAQRSYKLYGDRSHAMPPLGQGDLLYFVSHQQVRCAIDVERVVPHRGGHLAVGTFRPGITVDHRIEGFRGWRMAWWQPNEIKPFPDWRDKGVFYPAKKSDRHQLRFGAPVAPAVPALAHGKTPSEQGGSSV